MQSQPQPLAFTEAQVQYIKDVEHLKIIAIFDYVLGGMIALYSSFGLIHLAMGLMFLTHAEWFASSSSAADAAVAPMMGWIFTIVGGSIVTLGWTLGGLTAYSGYLIQHRKRRLFSQIIAGLNCISFPLGTILGVTSLIKLSKPSVVALYEGNAPLMIPIGSPSIDAVAAVDPDEHEEKIWQNLEQSQQQKQEP